MSGVCHASGCGVDPSFFLSSFLVMSAFSLNVAIRNQVQTLACPICKALMAPVECQAFEGRSGSE